MLKKMDRVLTLNSEAMIAKKEAKAAELRANQEESKRKAEEEKKRKEEEERKAAAAKLEKERELALPVRVIDDKGQAKTDWD